VVAHLLSTPTKIFLGQNLQIYYSREPTEVRDAVYNFVKDLKMMTLQDLETEKLMYDLGYPYLIPERIAQSISI
jgi:hypothetical protein